MYHFFVYAPIQNTKEIKDAMFNLGIGSLGKYSNCVWSTKGSGEFKPLDKACPFIGTENQYSNVEEMKLEFFIPEGVNIIDVITTLKLVHPYETPAYGIIKLDFH